MNNKKYLRATDWRTNKEFSRELSTSHPLETKLDIYCPFDNTSLIKAEEKDTGETRYSCPSCQTDYSETKTESQPNINDFAKSYLKNIEQKINNLEKAKNDPVQRCDCSELEKLRQWYEWVADVNLVNLSEQDYKNNNSENQKQGKILDFNKKKDELRRKKITKLIIENSKSF